MITRLKNKLYAIEQAIHDARASMELSQLGLSYKPWPGSAIAPSALRTILNEIEINKRNTIVEFGCGLSTLYIAKLLERTGGHITTFENNETWATLVREWIGEEGLLDHVTIVIAPLASCSFSLDNLEWYDEIIVANTISKLSIDCVLVDGPVAYQQGHELARYPALPAVRKQLAKNSVFFLDDIRRAGEQEILKKWSAQSGITFQKFPGRGGLACGVCGKAFFSGS